MPITAQQRAADLEDSFYRKIAPNLRRRDHTEETDVVSLEIITLIQPLPLHSHPDSFEPLTTLPTYEFETFLSLPPITRLIARGRTSYGTSEPKAGEGEQWVVSPGAMGWLRDRLGERGRGGKKVDLGVRCKEISGMSLMDLGATDPFPPILHPLPTLLTLKSLRTTPQFLLPPTSDPPSKEWERRKRVRARKLGLVRSVKEGAEKVGVGKGQVVEVVEVGARKVGVEDVCGMVFTLQPAVLTRVRGILKDVIDLMPPTANRAGRSEEFRKEGKERDGKEWVRWEREMSGLLKREPREMSSPLFPHRPHHCRTESTDRVEQAMLLLRTAYPVKTRKALSFPPSFREAEPAAGLDRGTVGQGNEEKERKKRRIDWDVEPLSPAFEEDDPLSMDVLDRISGDSRQQSRSPSPLDPDSSFISISTPCSSQSSTISVERKMVSSYHKSGFKGLEAKLMREWEEEIERDGGEMEMPLMPIRRVYVDEPLEDSSAVAQRHGESELEAASRPVSPLGGVSEFSYDLPISPSNKEAMVGEASETIATVGKKDVLGVVESLLRKSGNLLESGVTSTMEVDEPDLGTVMAKRRDPDDLIMKEPMDEGDSGRYPLPYMHEKDLARRSRMRESMPPRLETLFTQAVDEIKMKEVRTKYGVVRKLGVAALNSVFSWVPYKFGPGGCPTEDDVLNISRFGGESDKIQGMLIDVAERVSSGSTIYYASTPQEPRISYPDTDFILLDRTEMAQKFPERSVDTIVADLVSSERPLPVVIPRARPKPVDGTSSRFFATVPEDSEVEEEGNADQAKDQHSERAEPLATEGTSRFFVSKVWSPNELPQHRDESAANALIGSGAPKDVTLSTLGGPESTSTARSRSRLTLPSVPVEVLIAEDLVNARPAGSEEATPDLLHRFLSIRDAESAGVALQAGAVNIGIEPTGQQSNGAGVAHEPAPTLKLWHGAAENPADLDDNVQSFLESSTGSTLACLASIGLLQNRALVTGLEQAGVELNYRENLEADLIISPRTIMVFQQLSGLAGDVKGLADRLLNLTERYGMVVCVMAVVPYKTRDITASFPDPFTPPVVAALEALKGQISRGRAIKGVGASIGEIDLVYITGGAIEAGAVVRIYGQWDTGYYAQHPRLGKDEAKRLTRERGYLTDDESEYETALIKTYGCNPFAASYIVSLGAMEDMVGLTNEERYEILEPFLGGNAVEHINKTIGRLQAELQLQDSDEEGSFSDKPGYRIATGTGHGHASAGHKRDRTYRLDDSFEAGIAPDTSDELSGPVWSHGREGDIIMREQNDGFMEDDNMEEYMDWDQAE